MCVQFHIRLLFSAVLVPILLLGPHAGSTVHRNPGDRWMVHGPTDFIPRIEIGKFQRRYETNFSFSFFSFKLITVFQATVIIAREIDLKLNRIYI